MFDQLLHMCPSVGLWITCISQVLASCVHAWSLADLMPVGFSF